MAVKGTAKIPPALGKLLYGALFVLVLPALLVIWAERTRGVVTIRPFHSLPVGIALLGAGLALMFAAMAALRIHGGGLPMNAYPPPRLVTRGAYRITSHPIYVGFCAACAGAAIAAGSASGLFLVTPAMILGSAALVLGYEQHDLTRRFGPDRPKPWLHLAPDEVAPPSIAERVSAYALVILPWGILYQAVAWIGVPEDACAPWLPFERGLPVLEEAEVVYASTYLLVLVAPLVAATRRDLRAFEVRGLLSMALVFPLYLALPLIAPPRPFVPHGLLGELLLSERALDTPAAAFPSFHVIWALIAAEVVAARWPRARMIFRGLAALIALSCVATGMHLIVDVVAGFVVFALLAWRHAVWEAIRRAAERVANSWWEARVGGLRIINHGLYAGIGTFGALVIVGSLLGPGHSAAVALSALGGLLGAGIWAQVIEGSPLLMRPYGFYGGVLGIIVAGAVAPWFGTSTWLLLAGYCVAGPLVQSLGRVRCLVQGCCHGAPAPASIGICYTHPRSRVTRIAGLGGVPLHPTQVYSIGWNGVVALAMGRLWALGMEARFIGGVYLLLTGIGRFVEESYRGEPQTMVLGGLRFYQWVAIATVVGGAALMAVGGGERAGAVVVSGWAVVHAAWVGVVVGAALGVDFPGSQRRFSRLA